MNIKILIPFTLRDSTTGELTSYQCGQVYAVTQALGTQLIADGLAVEYLDIIPYGIKNITVNGTYDVTEYASAVVNVSTITVTYDVNGGTGTVAAVTVAAGNAVTLNDGTGITAPTNKEFAGWATSASATAADVTSPYTPTADITLYAVYTATE